MYCEGWGTVYVTDDRLDTDGNPWDEPPAFWDSLVRAATGLSAMTCDASSFSGVSSGSSSFDSANDGSENGSSTADPSIDSSGSRSFRFRDTWYIFRDYGRRVGFSGSVDSLHDQ